MFVELYPTNHGLWPPGSLILTVVMAGPAGIGSNYPEGAPPEASIHRQMSSGLWIARVSGFVLGDSPAMLGLC